MSLRPRWLNIRRTSLSIRSNLASEGGLWAWRVVPVILLATLFMASGCAMPGDAAPVRKIGLIAPFEGVGRPLGYAVLPAVKAALAEANRTGALGRYRVALVALNDDLSPDTAAAQARALAQDAAVVAVLGPFSADTAAAAAPILAAAGIPALTVAPPPGLADGIRSLCPPPDQLAAALQSHAAASPWPEPPDVFFPGDAAAAADRLVAQRAAGRDALLLGGPDVLRPWLPERGGQAAEGTRAAACVIADVKPVPGELPEVALARAGAGALLRALAADINLTGRPTRAGVAAALAGQVLEPGLAWYQVQGGQWQPLAGAD